MFLLRSVVLLVALFFVFEVVLLEVLFFTLDVFLLELEALFVDLFLLPLKERFEVDLFVDRLLVLGRVVVALLLDGLLTFLLGLDIERPPPPP